MAVVFRSLGKRSLSAVLFVALLLGCVLFSYYSFSVFFLVAAVMGLREFYRLAAAAGASPYSGMGLAAGVIVYLLFLNWDMYTPGPHLRPHYFLALLPALMLVMAMWDRAADPLKNAMVTLGGIFYVVLPFALLHELVFAPAFFQAGPSYDPRVFLGMLFLIWSNDTFAYLWGSALGRHKLFERISPGKTWEGTVLGALTTYGVSFAIGKYLLGADGWLWPFLGLAVPLAATLGDLAESYIKRLAGVKDSGNIMPGHGGVLDRFDSLLFVSPLMVILSKLL
jgi:phosphatidate cytidylyltransferase